MSYTVTVWESPADAPPPADLAQAESLLAQQRRRPPHAAPNPRFLALGQALYERYPPTGDDAIALDVWLDGSEEGQTPDAVNVFGLLTDSAAFEAAYLHAVAEARRQGLHLYDPQSGEHFLADGRTLRPGEPPSSPSVLADDLWAAEVAWRQLDWKAARIAWREAIAEGNPWALHAQGLSLVRGLGSAPFRLAGTALMVLADLDHPACQKAREAAMAALGPDLRPELDPLVAAWRAAPDVLAAQDAARHAETERRKQLDNLPWDVPRWKPDAYAEMRRLAADGHAPAAARLAYALREKPEVAAPLAGVALAEAPAAARAWALAGAHAATGDDEWRPKIVATHLLLGDAGWPLDPAGALYWLRRAALARHVAGVDVVINNLIARRAKPWDPVADRARAQALLGSIDEKTPLNIRLAKLRRACELDHPDAWRQMGQAYQTGAMGIARDLHVGNALVLLANKSLATSGGALASHIVADIRSEPGYHLEASLRLARSLIAAADPWRLIAEDQKREQNATYLSGSFSFEKGSQLEVIQRDTRGPKARAKAKREADEALRRDLKTRAQAQHEASAPPLASSLLMLWAGAAGAVLWVGRNGGPGGGGGRLVLVLLGALAAFGAWRCARLARRGRVGQIIAAGAAALPMLGLLQAGELTLSLWRERQPAPTDE